MVYDIIINSRAQNKYLKLISDLVEIVTLLQIVDDSSLIMYNKNLSYLDRIQPYAEMG